MHRTTQYGLSTHLFHQKRLERDDLARIHDAGFPLVELFATRTHVDYHEPRDVEAVRAWLEAIGLTAWSVHLPIVDGIRAGAWGRSISNGSTDSTSWEEALHETTAAIAAAGAWGARVAVLHLGVPDEHGGPRDNDEGAVRRGLEPIARACRNAGVQLALEVIPNRLSTADAIAAWLGGDLDLGPTGACLDVGHAHMTGGVTEAIDALSGHIISTHIHDNAGTADDHRVPGDGTIDWASALFALAKVGYGGPLIFELPDHGDATRTLAAAARARLRIQAILDELRTPFPFEDA